MDKDKREIKDKPRYKFNSGERNDKATESTTTSKLKCGKIGIDCLIKN